MIQLFWFRSVRDNIPLLFLLSLLVNVGMWLERFIIIVTSLHRDFLPSSWDMYAPTRWDFAMFAGTIGLFLSLFFLFIRFLPAIAMFEMRTIVPEAKLKMETTTGNVMAHEHTSPTLYGMMAEFNTPGELVRAAERTRLAGYRNFDAYSPDSDRGAQRSDRHPADAAAVHRPDRRDPGRARGFGLEYWTPAIEYPMNVGGRPFHSWPQFIPVTFETTVLGAALACFVGMWALNGLPQPYHPVFNVPAFARASCDRFFLVVEATDPRFDLTRRSSFSRGWSRWEFPMSRLEIVSQRGCGVRAVSVRGDRAGESP